MKLWIVAILLLGCLTASSVAQTVAPVEPSLASDVAKLTQHNHRLAGSAAGRDAVDELANRLRNLGIDETLRLDFPVVALIDPNDTATLTAEGESWTLHPMRPNVIVPATTAGRITGPLVYVGRGEGPEMDRLAISGAVVAMEYDAGENWERAFARGAAAVVFLGSGEETAGEAKHTPVPLNLPRFYAPPSMAAALRQDRPRVTLESSASVSATEPTHGTNLVALVRGTQPGGEAMVVAVAVDSYGEVPSLSPAARRAANVAGLLRLAEALRADPPKRDVWLLFADAGAQRHRGARVFYDAVTMSPSEHESLTSQHEDELAQVGRAVEAIQTRAAISRDLRQRLQLIADAARADLDRKRQLLRRSLTHDPAMLAELSKQVESWDHLRRWLNQAQGWDAVPAEDADTLAQLVTATLEALEARGRELRVAIAQDQQRATLRQTLGYRGEAIPRVVLHIDLDLSDAGSTWSAVAGDWSHRLYEFRRASGEADAPGYHGRVLAALGQLADRSEPGRFARLDRDVLADPSLGELFVPGRYVNAGAVAGGYGISHVALMTGHDARVRDGQPSDTAERFDFTNFEAQLDEAVALLRDAASDPALSLPSGFTTAVFTARAGWDGQRPTGSFVTRRVTGGLSENRPASDALVALWPGDAGNAEVSWRALSHDAPADYLPFDLVAANQHGRFDILGLRRDIDEQLTTLAFDLDGDQLAAVPTQDTLAHPLDSAIRVDLFAGWGYGLTWWGGRDDPYTTTAVMRASSDAAYRPTLSLVGRGDRQRFWVLAERAIEPRLKVFEAQGPVALGFAEDDTSAEGVELSRFAQPSAWATQTARDLWRLNEGRLSSLRQRGVTSPDLEVLHAEAGRAIQAEDPPTVTALRSAALSQRVYPRLRATMDDLVYAIVVLLLLSIPFAFAMERLVFGAAGVYGRIAGFVAMFFATFGVLYATHPGFAVASTPVMIFLAFAIVLLSCLVIWVLVRRFQTELAKMQGRPPGSDGGGMRGVGAAVSMGMSTMRRRPTRTILTATTVVMLTFTVLCFANVRREIGVRSVGLGPATEAMPGRAVLVRELDAGPMALGTLDVLAGLRSTSTVTGPGDEEREATATGSGWIESWWRVPTAQDDRPIVVARVDDGRSVRLGGVLGVDPAVLRVWPRWAEALTGEAETSAELLRRGEVFLPRDTMDTLGLSAGDAVLVDGRPMVAAGETSAGGLSKLRQVDGETWLPIDVAAQSALRASAGQAAPDDNNTAGKIIRLSPSQVAVASHRAVAQLGGDLRSVTRWVGEDAEPSDVAEAAARVVESPVWVTGAEGAARLTLGNITRVSGVWRLVAPIMLGGLIIFGTLLGSISDRQKEIYTFSALGLGPRHVGMLFFAEAAVYAVVGGLGGQLLAQVVALGASWVSAWGWIRPVSINFASTQALFAIGVVMATVMISAIYPAIRASRSANPGLARAWTMPDPQPAPHDDELRMMFPFTVSAYDLTGVVAFLAEHFRQHADAGLGPFAASDVRVERDEQARLRLAAEVALAPFDLGVTQTMTLTGVASDIPGVDEVAVHLRKQSGTKGDWVRANRVFIKRLRRQFLVWRTLPADAVEQYRMTTLQALGETSLHKIHSKEMNSDETDETDELG